MFFSILSCLLLALGPGLLTGCGTSRALPRAGWPRYILNAEQTVELNLPHGERFDASGLLLTPAGDLLTVNDRGAAIYRIQLLPHTNAADLVRLLDCFTEAQLASFAPEKNDRYDCEGIAQDDLDRLYLCEEANRWVLRCDSQAKTVERLKIDWAPVEKYFSPDPNASFEGIAVGKGKLYVANEREIGRIIVVDLASWKVIDDFSVRPRGCHARDVHYSDLCWFDGALFALLRESSVVLKVDPASHRVLAEYDFRQMESGPEVTYWTRYPTSAMEGLAVNRDSIWLLTDNNGLGRVRYPDDLRPTLFKCARPDRDP